MPERAKIYSARGKTPPDFTFTDLAKEMGVASMALIAVMRGKRPSLLLATSLAKVIERHGVIINPNAFVSESNEG